MAKRNHSHSLIWTVLIGCLTLIVLLLLYLCMNGHVNYSESSISSDALMGIIATFIGVCSALMLGAQIYSVYSRTQTEREYNEKLNEITIWFKNSTSEHEKQLKSLNKSIKNLERLKHSVNDALAGIHYSDNKMLKGILNVLDNIVILTNHQEQFGDKYNEKVDYAIYSIAKNLKRYKDDITIKSQNVSQFIEFYNNWQEEYKAINFSSECGTHIEKQINRLNNIVNAFSRNILNSHFEVGINTEDFRKLNEYAQD